MSVKKGSLEVCGSRLNKVARLGRSWRGVDEIVKKERAATKSNEDQDIRRI